MTNARAGNPTVLGGDAYRLPWNNSGYSNVAGPVSHWVALLGWDGTHYLVVDPISHSSKNYVHRVTADQLTWYNADNPGYKTNPRMAAPLRNGTIIK